MASMCIYFIGIGITYKKTKDGEERWHILFPFNDCHSVKLYCLLEDKDEDSGFYGHLAKRGAQVKINVSNAESVTGSTSNFDKYVFDMTSAHTHGRVKPNDDWAEKGVLLKIENAQFSVFNYLQSYDEVKDYDVVLIEGADDSGGVNQGLLAHMVSAHIELGEKGSVDVKVDGKKIISSEAGQSCILLFDNDCEEIGSDGNTRQKKVSQNTVFSDVDTDMKMFYGLISDADQQTKQFRIKGKKKPGGISQPSMIIPKDVSLCNFNVPGQGVLKGVFTYYPRTGTPRLDVEKPCMFAQVTKPGDLP